MHRAELSRTFGGETLKMKKSGEGFITLMSVIIAGSIGLVLAGLLYMSSIWAIRSSGDDEAAAAARKAADACTEIALQNIHDNNSYTGSGNQSLGDGNCSFLVTNLGGSVRNITATGTVSGIYRKSSTTIDSLSPKIHISAWQETP